MRVTRHLLALIWLRSCCQSYVRDSMDLFDHFLTMRCKTITGHLGLDTSRGDAR